MPTAKVIPILEPVFLEVGAPKPLQTIIKDDGRHAVRCDICSTLITLTVSANPEHILTHRTPCEALHRRKNPPTDVFAHEDVSRGRDPRPSRLFSSNRHHPYYETNSRSSSIHSFASSASRGAESPAIPRSFSLPPAAKRECDGVDFAWTPGSVFDLYPWQQRSARQLGWTIRRIDEERNELRIRSYDCARILILTTTSHLPLSNRSSSRGLGKL
ncbi:hypothetical protein BKA70DRAFT_1306242 [Coprinopsis sp. MPI-PUGE-AT-0042]|nr:hypothetical protein BKA70DRAFT_1306242 [Coprinopsis sp. MPI-PUGE-AT-0042]